MRKLKSRLPATSSRVAPEKDQTKDADQDKGKLAGPDNLGQRFILADQGR